MINWSVDTDDFTGGRVVFTIPDPLPEASEIDPETGAAEVPTDPDISLKFVEPPDYVGDLITGSASLASIEAQENDFGFHINSFTADYEKRSGRIKVLIDVEGKAKPGMFVSLAYNVSFLAHNASLF